MRLVCLIVLLLFAPLAAADPVTLLVAAAVTAGAGAYFGVAILSSIGISLALSAFSGLLAKSKDAGFTAEASGRLATIRSPIETRRIVVGESLVSGPLVAYFFTNSTEQRPLTEQYTIPIAPAGSVPKITVAKSATFYSSDMVRFKTTVIHDRSPSYEYVVMQKVGSSPATGQYSVSGAGVYTFNVADAGAPVEIFYRYTVVGVEREWHWFVIPLSHGEVAEIGEIFLNGESVGALDGAGLATTGRFAGHVRVKKYLGTTTQTADPDLVAVTSGRWSASDRGQGVAYIIVALKRNANIWTSGIPNMQAHVRGALCEDTRDSVTRWTNNPALILRGYLRAEYGLACAADEVLDSLVTAAANICDERVAMAAHSVAFTADAATDWLTFAAADETVDTGDKVTVSNSGGGLPGGLAAVTSYYVIRARDGTNRAKLATSYANALAGTAIDITTAGTGTHTMAHVDQARYTCDGTINLADKPIDIITQLLTSMAGAAVYSMGSWRTFAGAYATPAHSFGAGDLRGDLEVRARTPRKELFNAVRGTYVNPFKDWQPGDFPPVTNATYAAQDGAEIPRDIELPYTINSVRAQRIAKIHLEKSRQQIVCSGPYKLGALKAAVWDTISVTDPELGWSSKVFRVIGWELSENGRGVQLTYQEDAAASYEWNAGDETTTDQAPDTDLPNPFFVSQPGSPVATEELYETSGSSGVKSRIILTCEPAPDAFVDAYQFEYKLSVDPHWLKLPMDNLGAARATLEDATPGIYDFRVAAVNTVLVTSLYSSIFGVTIQGLLDPPSDPTGFTVIKSTGFGLAKWDQCPDLDVQINGRVIIRHSPLISGATWNDGIIVDEVPGKATQAVVALITGTYMLKFRDSSGGYSGTAASFVVTEGMITGFTTVGTSTQASAFTGAKTDVVVSGVVLQLDTDANGVLPAGSYDFSAVLDLTTVATRRFEADIQASSFDASTLFDSVELFDGDEMFDGAEVNDCNVTLYAAVTDDNPAGSPVYKAWAPFLVADFTCRAAKFRLDFVSGSVGHNIAVETLTVHAKIPA